MATSTTVGMQPKHVESPSFQANDVIHICLPKWMSPCLQLLRHRHPYVVCDGDPLKYVLQSGGDVRDCARARSKTFYEAFIGKEAAESKGTTLFASGPKFV